MNLAARGVAFIAGTMLVTGLLALPYLSITPEPATQVVALQ